MGEGGFFPQLHPPCSSHFWGNLLTSTKFCRASSESNEDDEDDKTNREDDLEQQVKKLAELVIDKNKEIERLRAATRDMERERRQIREESKGLEQAEAESGQPSAAGKRGDGAAADSPQDIQCLEEEIVQLKAQEQVDF